MPAPHHVILDTDIGTDVDDLMALALIFGSPTIRLLGVTTVYGDTALRARMTKRIAEIAGESVAVHAGESTTLSGREIWWAGHEGRLYDDLGRHAFDGADGVDHLIEAVCASPGTVDVVAIGPLTNIATAIERDPRFAGAVRHLWVMGGSFSDEEEPEHNFRSDATAAAIVFASGIPTTVAGLEITRLITMGPDALDRMNAAGELGRVIDAEIRQWWEFWGTEWNVPHDPVTVLTLTRPELFRFSPVGRVEILRGEQEGVSRFQPGEGATRIVTGLDAEAVAEAIVVGIADAASNARV